MTGDVASFDGRLTGPAHGEHVSGWRSAVADENGRLKSQGPTERRSHGQGLAGDECGGGRLRRRSRHQPRGSGTSYNFVTDGIEKALQRAQEAAGSQDVLVDGSADIARQFLNAGLLNEVRLHLVPVVLGAGTRLFDGVRSDVRLSPSSATTSALVTHVTYQVERPAAGAGHAAAVA